MSREPYTGEPGEHHTVGMARAKVNDMRVSYKATVGELQALQPGCVFFRELIDTSSFKCYGIQHLSEQEALQAAEMGRFVGYYGRIEREFTAPFEVQRGHRIVVVRASKDKPVRCWEHLYGQN